MDPIAKYMSRFGGQVAGCDDDEIAQFEKNVGWTLPDDARRFFQTYGKTNTSSSPMVISNLASSASWILGEEERFGGFGLVPLFDRNDSNPFCISCDGPLTGYIVQVHHDDANVLTFRTLDDLFAALADAGRQEYRAEFDTFSKSPERTKHDVEVARALLQEATELEEDDFTSYRYEFAITLMSSDQVDEIVAVYDADNSFLRDKVAERLRQIGTERAHAALGELGISITANSQSASETSQSSGERIPFGTMPTEPRQPFDAPEFQDVEGRDKQNYTPADLAGIWWLWSGGKKAYRFSNDGTIHFIVTVHEKPGRYAIDGDVLKIWYDDETIDPESQMKAEPSHTFIIKIDSLSMTLCANDGYVYDRATRPVGIKSVFGSGKFVKVLEAPSLRFNNVEDRVRQNLSSADFVGRWREDGNLEVAHVFLENGGYQCITDDNTVNGVFKVDGDIVTLERHYENGSKTVTPLITCFIKGGIWMYYEDGYLFYTLQPETEKLVANIAAIKAVKEAEAAQRANILKAKFAPTGSAFGKSGGFASLLKGLQELKKGLGEKGETPSE